MDYLFGDAECAFYLYSTNLIGYFLIPWLTGLIKLEWQVVVNSCIVTGGQGIREN